MECQNNFAKKAEIKKNIIKNRYLYLLLLPGMLYFILIDYRAMYGILLAFKNFNPRLGIMGSKFVGLEHFRNLLADPYFWNAFVNTIKISFGRIIFSFPAPIILAILFNELRGRRIKKTLQTVYTFPHFLSWVIVAGIAVNFLSIVGPFNQLIAFFGGEKTVLLGSKKAIIPILYITDIWKEAGWSSVIYLAAITGIEQQLYEAAELDGANKWQQMLHVTLPGIRTTILVMLTLKVGTILNAGFDQIFNMSNSAVQSTIDILDTYIYRITFQTSGDFSYSTAVGLFKSVVNFSMLVVVDKISKKLVGAGIFS